MASGSATTIAVGNRDVRVSSPDRVIFAATAATPEVTKLDICQYFADIGDHVLRAIGDRPTAMERWPRGWSEGMRLATGPQDRDGDGFYQKRLPKGAPDWLRTVTVHTPNGRAMDELCPQHPADAVWAAQMGTLTFHPWPVRFPDVDHPDELRIDIDPQPGTTFADARRVAELTQELLAELGIRCYPKTSGNRGIHIYVRIAPGHSFEDIRHAAIGLGRELARRDDSVTTAWWKEERGARLFIDYNQNNRDRTIASAWSIRPRAGAPVSTPMTWRQLMDTTDPMVHNVATTRDYLADGDPWLGIDDEAFSIDPLLRLWESLPGGELNFPPDYPKMPGEPPRVQPSKKVAEHWDSDGQPIPNDG